MSEQPPFSSTSERASERAGERASPSDGAPSGGDHVETVDVTRYKTKELSERFQQLFGVTHLLPWAGFGLGGSLVATLSAWAMLFLPHAPLSVGALTFVYMALQGLLLGLLAASLLVLARIFQQLTAIVDITLQTLRQAFRDVRNIGDPGVRAELIGALVHGAIIPALKSAVTVKMGLLRAPIGVALNWLLDKTARRLTNSLKQTTESAGPLSFDGDGADQSPSADADDDESAEPSTTSEASRSTELIRNADSHLDRMHERVDVIARRTRLATMIPAALFFVFVAGVSSIPWLFALVVLI